MSIYKRGETWWLYIRHKGVRVRRSCETGDRDRAQAIHDQVRAELWRINPSGKTLYGALQAWLDASPRDPADRYRIDKLKKLAADQPLVALQVDEIEGVIPTSSPATFNRYASIITAALNLAKARGWMDAVPAFTRKTVRAHRLRWLTPKEWRRLRRELPEHLKPMAEFALLTGLRQRNVTHLEWSQIDSRRGVLWIHADQAKGRRPIGIPLSDGARSILTAQRGLSRQWVFPYEGRPIVEIKTAWRKALKRAKLEGVTWHTLRHTWASWHAMSGTPIPALKELGGWQTLSMVSRYTHLAPEHLRRYAGNAAKYSGHKKGHKVA